MSLKPRFVRAADNRRPYRSHRFDVWSPKLQRRVTLFGKRVFGAWLAIEADPSIVTFCERPLARKGTRRNRVIDFWVRRGTQEEIWVLLRPSELEHKEPGVSQFVGFDEWARKLAIVVKYIRPEESLLSEQAAANWHLMLHYLAANRDLISKPLLKRLQTAGSAGRSLQELEREFSEDDPVLVRCGVFSLVHRGTLAATDLSSTPMGPDTRVSSP